MTEPMTAERMLEIGNDPSKNNYTDAVLIAAWTMIRDRKEHRNAKAALRKEFIRRGIKVPPLTPPAKRYVLVSEPSPDAETETRPERTPAADLTDRQEILLRLAATQIGGLEEGNRIMFEAALEMFVLLGKLKTTEFNGRLLTTAEYLADALDAGVGRTYASEVIQFRMFDKIDDIRTEVKNDHDKHIAKHGDRVAFKYPSINAMLKPWREQTGRTPRMSNREAAVIRQENLDLMDKNQALLNEQKSLSDALEAERIEKNRMRVERSDLESTIERLKKLLAERDAEIARLKGGSTA